jgi:hypothetical protein
MNSSLWRRPTLFPLDDLKRRHFRLRRSLAGATEYGFHQPLLVRALMAIG